MASDYFAVLRQPRRPWLDPEQLKEQYQRLTFELHPDRPKAETEQSDFSAVTEAYRVLSNPRLRLRHLLDIEAKNLVTTGPENIPNDIADLFMQAATLVRDIDARRQKRDQNASALGKSLLQAEAARLESRTDEMIKRLESHREAALKDLQDADEAWIKDSSTATNQLRFLADRFGYLDRWISQLREKQFQLST